MATTLPIDVTYADPGKSFLYYRVKAFVESVDKRQRVRTLSKSNRYGTAGAIATQVSESAYLKPEGILNFSGGRRRPYEGGGKSSVLGVAWITRRNRKTGQSELLVRVKADRNDNGDTVFDNSPRQCVLEKEIREAQERRSARLLATVYAYLGMKNKGTAEEPDWGGDVKHLPNRKWNWDNRIRMLCHTADGMLTKNNCGDYFLLMKGYVINLPDHLNPGKPAWDNCSSPEAKVKKCVAWAKDAGYLPEDPMDGFQRLFGEMDGDRDKALDSIKRLMAEHLITLEDLR